MNYIILCNIKDYLKNIGVQFFFMSSFVEHFPQIPPNVLKGHVNNEKEQNYWQLILSAVT